jgi:predicted regulator of Ras-like GTPase activity (Roadblock/LC7/MglB family)
MLPRMDAAQALADLTEISSQVVHVAVLDDEGGVLATTIADEGRAARFVEGVTTLLVEAEALRQARGLPTLSQLEAATLEGSVFIVRRDEGTGGARVIAATTRPDPTVGLVFYDLKHCLRAIADASGNGRRRRTRKAAGDGP